MNRQDRIGFVSPPHRCSLPAGAMPGRVSTELPEHPEATAHEERDGYLVPCWTRRLGFCTVKAVTVAPREEVAAAVALKPAET